MTGQILTFGSQPRIGAAENDAAGMNHSSPRVAGADQLGKDPGRPLLGASARSLVR